MKSCKNCDHGLVCATACTGNLELEDKCCKHWSGWHDVKEELPKENGTYIVYGKWGSGKEMTGDCEFKKEDGYFRACWNFDVIAWRELPKYGG